MINSINDRQPPYDSTLRLDRTIDSDTTARDTGALPSHILSGWHTGLGSRIRKMPTWHRCDQWFTTVDTPQSTPRWNCRQGRSRLPRANHGQFFSSIGPRRRRSAKVATRATLTGPRTARHCRSRSFSRWQRCTTHSGCWRRFSPATGAEVANDEASCSGIVQSPTVDQSRGPELAISSPGQSQA